MINAWDNGKTDLDNIFGLNSISLMLHRIDISIQKGEVFSVYFPAGIGILAGANVSGDLRVLKAFRVNLLESSD